MIYQSYMKLGTLDSDGSGTRNQSKKQIFRQVLKKAFLHFEPYFWHISCFLSNFFMKSTTIFKLPFNPFHHGTSKIHNLGFGYYPISSLVFMVQQVLHTFLRLLLIRELLRSLNGIGEDDKLSISSITSCFIRGGCCWISGCFFRLIVFDFKLKPFG